MPLCEALIFSLILICRDPPEPTGDEPEDFEYEAPKIYEPVSDTTYAESKTTSVWTSIYVADM